MKYILSGLIGFGSLWANAAELPTGLNETDIKDMAKAYALGSKHRSWTAHSIPNSGLGLDLGLEATFVARDNLHTRGQGDGVIPRTIPVPRLWGAWDLGDFFASGSYAPGNLFDGIQAVGFGVQWTYFREKSRDFNFSAILEYTYSDVFSQLSSHTTTVMQQISKDMIFWQPYAAVGVTVANASADPLLLAADTEEGPYTVAAMHWMLGVRLDFLAKVAFQLDFVNLTPSFSLILSNAF